MPLQQKMLVMTLLICGAVLLVAIAAFFAFQVLNFRSNFERNTSTLAAIIANNSNAAMTFNDDKMGREIVGSLKVKPDVLYAALVMPDGSILAQYPQNYHVDTLSGYPQPGEFRYTAGHVLFTQPVLVNGERIGTLYLHLDYDQTYRQLIRFYGQIILGVTTVSIGLAVFLSGRLGRTISGPLLRLAATAKLIGEKKDYSMRATVTGRGDELGQLAESFNEMLGRIQSQDAALSLSQQKMEALIHSIDGIVWERTPDTFQFTFISRQSKQILGYDPQTWLEQPNFWDLKLHPQDSAKTIKTGHEMAARGEPYTLEYRMIAADGRTVWIRESGTVLVENGKPMALRGIFLDITQQKVDAEELDKLNRQLVDASRSAGMADVATGVLHNVGNVLNSVSVSATVVANRLRQSKVSKLSRVALMMRERNGHLAEYLTADPKGKLIPEFISTVSDELAGEQRELIGKMEMVGQHIEHIKEIVAMQQSYAKVSGAFENLPVRELVEDAIRINATAFERHHIELVREFGSNIPPVCVDRHKFLQIFINLLRNAKHAVEEVKEEERRLIIRVDADSPDWVKLVVIDNGIGIPPENLNKIFNHGFTTKKDGHGFGLHSGANAAKEMGGKLTGFSQGPGRGAEFTLLLPVAKIGRRQISIQATGKI